MNWTNNKPTVPGWYWVLTPDFPCRGKPCATLVEQRAHDRTLHAWVPFMDYDEPVSTLEGEWVDALWLGPIEPPEAPK